jgi:DNA polymerase I-like protein with 3'-5' exonuclease and polymerase domains
MEKLIPVAIDTETFLIRMGLLAPPLVCVSVSGASGTDIFDRVSAEKHVRALLEQDNTTIVGANIAYDCAVLSNEFPSLLLLIFEKYEKGLVSDVQIRQMLMDIEQGDWRTKTDAEGKVTRTGYSLADLAKTRLGFEMDKTTWRTGYAKLRDIPLSEWPQGAIDYAKGDAEITLRVWQDQQGGCPCWEIDNHTCNLAGEADQVRAAFALHLMSCWGMRTDPETVKAFKDDLAAKDKAFKDVLTKHGIIRPNGTKDVAAVRARLEASGFEVDRTPTGQVKIDADSLKRSGDPVLETLAEAGGVQKLLTTYVPVLERGTKHPIQARYHVLARSGRTSCLAPWTPIRTAKGTKKLSDVVVGDSVWTHRNRWKKVTAFLEQGEKKVVSVTFSTGKVLTCTTDHRLLTSEGWKTVKEIADERFEKMGIGSKEPSRGFEDVSQYGSFHSRENSNDAWYNSSKRDLGFRQTNAGCGASGVEGSSLFRVQNGRQESHVAENGGGSPQLGRGMRERPRILDGAVERKASSRSSSCDDGGVGLEGASAGMGRTPYRRESEEQQRRQSSPSDGKRTQRYSLLTSEGQPFCTVEEVVSKGSVEVFDLTVEDDHSFEACGVFVHNCASPNLQNLPREPGVREAFCARPGFTLAFCDYSILELRCLAQVLLQVVGWSRMAEALQSGRELHLALAAQIIGIEYDEALSRKGDKDVKEARQLAKVGNFGFPGGMGPEKLVDFARAAYGLRLTVSQCSELRSNWFKAFPEMREYFTWVSKEIGRAGSNRLGSISQLSGRVRGGVGFCDAANTVFQGLAADGAKDACWGVAKKCYYTKTSPLYGSRPVVFVHDEIGAEVPEGQAHEALKELEDTMKATMQKFTPDIPQEVSGLLSRVWSKNAERIEKNGRVISWELT